MQSIIEFAVSKWHVDCLFETEKLISNSIIVLIIWRRYHEVTVIFFFLWFSAFRAFPFQHDLVFAFASWVIFNEL